MDVRDSGSYSWPPRAVAAEAQSSMSSGDWGWPGPAAASTSSGRRPRVPPPTPPSRPWARTVLAGVAAGCLVGCAIAMVHSRQAHGLRVRSTALVHRCVGADADATCRAQLDGDADAASRLRATLADVEGRYGRYVGIAAPDGYVSARADGDGFGRVVLDVRFSAGTLPATFEYELTMAGWRLVDVVVDGRHLRPAAANPLAEG